MSNKELTPTICASILGMLLSVPTISVLKVFSRFLLDCYCGTTYLRWA